MRLRRILEGHLFDALILVTIAISILEVWLDTEVEGSELGLTAMSLVWGPALLARRRAPILAPTFYFAVIAVQILIWPHSVTYSFGTLLMTLLAAGWFGACLVGARARLAGAALVIGTIVLAVGINPARDWTDLLTVVPFAGFAWLVGHAHRANAERTAGLRERAARLERERDAEARTAVAEERARIAREMHDVVAHSLSVMVVQAEAAEEMIGIDPERARRPLVAVQETGRSALTELRRMLGVLREMADEAPELAPQPGVAGLESLAAHVRDAGLPVELRIEGEPRPLPAGVDLSAFRIVQEGLTNALKHAGPARAEVLVRYADRELELRVSDDGRGTDPGANGGGHGLLGMRERVALYGGRLDAGPRPEGGFALSARLPLDARPPA